MPSNHISISSATTIGAGARAAIEAVRAARVAIQKYYGIMSEFGTEAQGVTALAAELGTSDADALIVRSNFLNSQTVLQGADISYLLNRLGQ